MSPKQPAQRPQAFGLRTEFAGNLVREKRSFFRGERPPEVVFIDPVLARCPGIPKER